MAPKTKQAIDEKQTAPKSKSTAKDEKKKKETKPKAQKEKEASKAPEVDAELSRSDNYTVIADENGKYLSAYLMNSDCDENKNKYYILQLLKNISDDSIMLWTRYGRVGRTGGSNKEVMDDVESGIRAYEKTFAQKTGKGKGYQPIEMKLGKEEAFV